MISPKTHAALGSFGRSLAATGIAAYLQLGKQPLDLRVEDLRALGNAIIGAAILFAFNYVRPGETRFGLHSADLGMGGDDVLELPDGQVPEKVLAVEEDFVTNGIAQLVQTDNRPREGDPEPLTLPDETFQNQMR